MNLGRHQLGCWLDVYLFCQDADGTPTLPDAAPTLKIRQTSDESLIYVARMAVVDREGGRAVFAARVFLGESFTTGQHTVQMAYVVGGAVRYENRTFDIIPGGNADGQVLSMHWYQRPHAGYLVYQLESGQIFKGANPRVD